MSAIARLRIPRIPYLSHITHIEHIHIDRALLLVCLYAAVHFLYSSWIDTLNPIWRTNLDAGWYIGADQGSYLRLAREMAGGRVGNLILGPGYPLIAVPFLWLMPDDPFRIPNLLMYVLTMGLVFRFARLFLSVEWSAVTVVLLSQSSQLLSFFVRPWSNSVTVVAMAVLLAMAEMARRRPYMAAVFSGLFLGWTLSARYGDVLLLTPVALLVVLASGSDWRRRLQVAVVIGLAAAPLVLWTGWLHAEKFGSPLHTPYRHHPSPLTGHDSQSIESRSLRYVGYHLFSTFINPHVFTTETRFPPIANSLADRPLFSYYFLFLFSGVGLAFMRRQQRGLIYAALISLGMALLYYGSFWSSAAHDLRHAALRFYGAWIPLLFCAGMVGLRSLLHLDWRAAADRRLALAGLAAPVLLAGVLYAWGVFWPPFPDTERMIPKNAWKALSSAQVSLPPEMAIDRSVARPWRADGLQPAGTSLTVDMGHTYEVRELFLAKEAGKTMSDVMIDVTYSLDGTSWSDPAGLRVTLLEERIMAFDFAPFIARFVRFTLMSDSPPTGWEIGEIYAYGDRVNVPDAPIWERGGGWHASEQAPEGYTYRWMFSPAQLEIQAPDATMAALAFRVHATAQPTSTMELMELVAGDETLARFAVAPERQVFVGPLMLPEGVSGIELRALQPNVPESSVWATDSQRPINLALSDIRLLSLWLGVDEPSTGR